MKIFIAGGTGFVGGHIVDELHERGHEVRLLVHAKKPGVSGRIEQVEGDVTRPETYEHAADGCDAIINLVGIIREFPLQGITFEKLHVNINLLPAASVY